MTTDEFNERYKDYLEEGFYGLIIEDPRVVNYLNEEFQKEIKINPKFEFSQIKIKFGMARVYTNSDKNMKWEQDIENILKLNSKIL